MVMGAEVVGAPGLFYIHYGAGLWKAGKVIVYGLNCQLLGCSFGESLPMSQIGMVVGSMGSHADALGPLPLSSIQLWPG